MSHSIGIRRQILQMGYTSLPTPTAYDAIADLNPWKNGPITSG